MSILNTICGLFVAYTQASIIAPDAAIHKYLDKVPVVKLEGSASQTEDSHKIPIPRWLAGKWRAYSETALYTDKYGQTGFTTGRPHSFAINKIYFREGNEDENGKFWQPVEGFEIAPAVKPNLYVEQTFNHFLIKNKTIDTWDVASYSEVKIYEKKTGSLCDAYLEETTISYEKINTNVVSATIKISDWDLFGRPLKVSKVFRLEKRL